MKRESMKKMLISMLKNNEKKKTTKYHNYYEVRYLEATDEYQIGRQNWDAQITGSILYTDAERFQASEIDKLAKG